MTSALNQPARRVEDLTPAERERLEAAHTRLREAVAAYDRFVGGALKPGTDVEAHPIEAMADAQREVDEAEQELWRLRKELLGWERPVSAPRASLVADWFCEEDSVYDDLDGGAGG